MQQSNKPATGLAFFFLVLMLAALATRFWAGEKGAGFTGPTHIAAGGGHVYLHAGDNLYSLKGSGELISVIPPAVSGLKDVPIDIRVLGDGQLLIAEQDPPSISVCLPESWQCRSITPAAVSLIKRQFKVLPPNTENELFLTDARGDTLWKIAATGEPLKLVPDRTLAGPNDLAFDADGSLWVADTDHRRIIELKPLADGTFEPGRVHSANNSHTIGERYYPMMLVRAEDNRWWVTQAADFSEAFADVVVYDPEQGAQSVIDLPKGAYPTDIAVLGKAMLVTDMERYTVYRVDSETLGVSEFGDGEFRNHLARIQKSRMNYQRLSTGSLVAIVLFAALMISAAIWVTPKKRRWTEPPGALDVENAAERVPESKGIHWLERDPKFDRTLRWLEPLTFVFIIALILGAVVLYAWMRLQLGQNPDGDLESKLNEAGMALLLAGLGLIFMVPVIHFQVRNLKNRLGTDGQKLYIKLTDGRELSVEPARLFYTKRILLYRKYSFPLQGAKQRSIYKAGEIDTWLAPLLRDATKLSAIEAMKYQWKNRKNF